MPDREELVRDILAAAGGEIVGRVRMQKIVYLLDRLGMNAELDYSYHHYGPFSEELSIALERAILLDRFVEEEPKQGHYGTYSVYKTAGCAEGTPPETIGDFDFDRAARMIERIKSESSVVAELAATIHWLREEERVEDWRDEIVRRKPLKVRDGALEKAESLLDELRQE